MVSKRTARISSPTQQPIPSYSSDTSEKRATRGTCHDTNIAPPRNLRRLQPPSAFRSASPLADERGESSTTSAVSEASPPDAPAQHRAAASGLAVAPRFDTVEESLAWCSRLRGIDTSSYIKPIGVVSTIEVLVRRILTTILPAKEGAICQSTLQPL